MAVGGAVIPKGTYVAISNFASGNVADLNTLGVNFSLMFISNGNTFDGIYIQTSAMGIPYLYYGSTLVFSTSWQNEAYKTVVLETNQDTNINFYDWFNACFTLQPDNPEPTEYIEVTYADKVFKLAAGQKLVFKGGKVMQGDITAKVVEEEEVKLISFTIDGTEYKAEEGMSWADWVADTRYNTIGAIISSSGHIYDSSDFEHIIRRFNLPSGKRYADVKKSEEIYADKNYNWIFAPIVPEDNAPK